MKYLSFLVFAGMQWDSIQFLQNIELIDIVCLVYSMVFHSISINVFAHVIFCNVCFYTFFLLMHISKQTYAEYENQYAYYACDPRLLPVCCPTRFDASHYNVFSIINDDVIKPDSILSLIKERKKIIRSQKTNSIFEL